MNMDWFLNKYKLPVIDAKQNIFFGWFLVNLCILKNRTWSLQWHHDPSHRQEMTTQDLRHEPHWWLLGNSQEKIHSWCWTSHQPSYRNRWLQQKKVRPAVQNVGIGGPIWWLWPDASRSPKKYGIQSWKFACSDDNLVSFRSHHSSFCRVLIEILVAGKWNNQGNSGFRHMRIMAGDAEIC